MANGKRRVVYGLRCQILKLKYSSRAAARHSSSRLFRGRARDDAGDNNIVIYFDIVVLLCTNCVVRGVPRVEEAGSSKLAYRVRCR